MAKDKGGRPRKEIDYPTLEKLCGIACTGEECAAILDVDYDTLDNRLAEDNHGGFSDYFKKHSSKGNASLRRKQFEVANQGSVPMLIWLGKQRLGQLDKPAEVQESDGLIDALNSIAEKLE